MRNDAGVKIDVFEAGKRPVSAVADHKEIRDVVSVEVAEDSAIDLYLMFDPGHALDERIISEQFRY